MNSDVIVDDLIPTEPADPAILLPKEAEQERCIHISLGPFSVEDKDEATRFTT